MDVTLPTGLYRLQLRPHLDLKTAAGLVSYLHMLGVSHLYSAPLFSANSRSEHGYDVVDPTRVDHQLGGWRGFLLLHEQLKAHGMGLILDIVPNHMAATHENKWWNHVLSYGEVSPYAKYFDINWYASRRKRLKGRLLLPVLGDAYAECLKAGAFTLSAHRGRLMVNYGPLQFPLRPGTYSRVLVTNARKRAALVSQPETMGELMDRQAYQLAHWTMANDEINYRRFFDVTQLVGVRVEKGQVFCHTHAFIKRLVAAGMVQGVRVDHVDGLYDPGKYLRQLRRLLGWRCYIVVEKILEAGELLSQDWPVQGTTGYDFIRLVEGLMLDKGAMRLVREYHEMQDKTLDFDHVVYRSKRLVIAELFWGQWDRLTRELVQVVEDEEAARDISQRELSEALATFTACLGVYRTYLDRGPLSYQDREELERARVEAQGRDERYRRSLRLLGRVVALDVRARGRARDWVRAWQQWTGAVMAKGYEDTSLYRYLPLPWLNEVGGNPHGQGLTTGEFHQRMLVRSNSTVNATSTHDTKLSEDVRARLQVLSHWPDSFIAHCHQWSEINAPHKSRVGGREIPDKKVENLLYQTLLGMWPLCQEQVAEVEERLCAYLQKAVREGKEYSSWLAVDEEYEQALLAFARSLLREEAFLHSFTAYQDQVAYQGAINSLVQLTLKLTVPGIPDVYQGNELWDFSLVDPDNRRPIDFEARINSLDHLSRQAHQDRSQLLRQLRSAWRDGRIKMYVLWSLLQLRRHLSVLFARGQYVPLPVAGEGGLEICAFLRRRGQDAVLVAVLLHTASTHPETGEVLWQVGANSLGEQRVCTGAVKQRSWVDLFSGRTLEPGESLYSRELFRDLPLAVLTTGRFS